MCSRLNRAHRQRGKMTHMISGPDLITSALQQVKKFMKRNIRHTVVGSLEYHNKGVIMDDYAFSVGVATADEDESCVHRRGACSK